MYFVTEFMGFIHAWFRYSLRRLAGAGAAAVGTASCKDSSASAPSCFLCFFLLPATDDGACAYTLYVRMLASWSEGVVIRTRRPPPRVDDEVMLLVDSCCCCCCCWREYCDLVFTTIERTKKNEEERRMYVTYIIKYKRFNFLWHNSITLVFHKWKKSKRRRRRPMSWQPAIVSSSP